MPGLADKTVLIIGTPQDIATVAVMALTSSFLTGVTIPVDGGEHLV